jgi:hypothetical protein
MAGEWIKMRSDLFEHPKVFKLADLLGVDEFAAVGMLFCFWAWADKHSVDGRVDAATTRLVDKCAHKNGFAEALVSIGWLIVDADGITIPRFNEHNGDSAKERTLKNQRQARWRAGKKDSCVDEQASTGASTQATTREEKRREEKSSSSLRSEDTAADATAPAPKPAKQPKAPKPQKTAMPPDFGISDRVRVWAGQHGFDALEAHLEAFKRKVDANGYAYVNWDSAFMEAVREDWAKIRARPLGQSFAQQAADIARMTVPSKPGRDPALLQIEADREKAVPIPENIKARLAALKGGAGVSA